MKIAKSIPTPLAVRHPMDRLFDRLFEGRFNGIDFPNVETLWAPPVDFAETEKDYVVRIEAPGMTREDFDVNLEGHLLTLSGRREFSKDEETEEMIWREREQGAFVRSIRLPKAVRPDKVDAVYADGVLTVRLPKAEPTPKNKIPIK